MLTSIIDHAEQWTRRPPVVLDASSRSSIIVHLDRPAMARSFRRLLSINNYFTQPALRRPATRRNYRRATWHRKHARYVLGGKSTNYAFTSLPRHCPLATLRIHNWPATAKPRIMTRQFMTRTQTSIVLLSSVSRTSVKAGTHHPGTDEGIT